MRCPPISMHIFFVMLSHVWQCLEAVLKPSKCHVVVLAPWILYLTLIPSLPPRCLGVATNDSVCQCALHRNWASLWPVWKETCGQ